jgi:hypothetical protein
VIEAAAGISLVESTPGAEAFLVTSTGVLERTSGFTRLELPALPEPEPANWPSTYQFTVTLPLTAGRSKKRPYVAVWIEDSTGMLVRPLAVWGTKSKYQVTLPNLWRLVSRYQSQMHAVTRATRSAGTYELVWDGLDTQRRPAAPGTYRIVVETDQEGGTYAKQSGIIELGDQPASITLPATANFGVVSVEYGPKRNRP